MYWLCALWWDLGGASVVARVVPTKCHWWRSSGLPGASLRMANDGFDIPLAKHLVEHGGLLLGWARWCPC
eukprot:13411200-Alexandrium_andersonii.AAC.1